jgi:16S rRNA C967 or C1407 C5-methylase (RsmB/RsmF family)/NOL1/NOP2/fmu family ribosome biogenesis protein
MFPEEFRLKIKQQQYIDSEELLQALERSSPVSIRINRKKWKHNPVNSEPVSWCPDGFYLKERPSFTLDPLFHSGCYYPQEASGMFLEKIFRQTVKTLENIRVLDLCGAPGGKATHLSTLIGQNGLLVANEVIRTRASVLAENLTRWGLSNVIVTQNDPSDFKRLPGFFDVILADAPCSGEGMFRDKIAVKEWSVENTLLCSERQKRILREVWPALKENGILIYSTCTFNPEENEKNIKWLSERHKTGSVTLDISNYNSITEIDYEGIRGYGFYPGKVEGEGLFVSVLSKKEKQTGMEVKYKQGSDRGISREEKNIAEKLTHFSADNLIKQNEEIIAAPGNISDRLPVLKNLRAIKSGTRLFTVKNGSYKPSHELALSIFFRSDSFPVINLDYTGALFFLRRGNILPGDSQKGWNIVCYEGVCLGFVNNIGSRVNNYYPVEWRIRMDTSSSDKERIIKWYK